MTRARHFLKGLGSGYLLLAVNALSTFISLPLALHYLNRSEFNIWIIAVQAANYLAMIDLGTTSAGIRLLVDHKDAPAGGAYGGMIKSMVLTQFIQAALILIVGFAGVSLLSAVLEIPAPLVHDFNVLWCWQVIFLATNFAFRIGNLLLTAHQRLDISNYAQIGSQVLNLAVTVAAFVGGLKLYSLILAQGVALVLLLVWTLVACVRLKLLPPPGGWGAISREHLKTLFSFGWEVFLVVVGSLFINSTQVFLLTRFFPGDATARLDAASLWAVMTKLYTLLTQLVWRAVGVAVPAFSEMMVRGEHERLWRRYRSAFLLSVLASCYCGLLIGFGNTDLIELWTNGRMHWLPINDWLLAIWFVLQTQVYCHTSLVVNTKQVRAVKYMYFVEGVAFILLARQVVPHFGMPGMLACSIVCTAACTLAYGTLRVAVLAQVPPWKIFLEWLAPVPRLVLLTLPLGVVLALLTRHSLGGRLAGCVIPVAIVGALVALRYCVPREVAAELISHLPGWSRRPARMLAGHRGV